MIGIINANSGNLGSLINALNFLNIKSKIINEYSEIHDFKKIILPGVGSFSNLKKNLLSLNLYEALKKFIENDKNYFLGICVGMQILLTKGTEDGQINGFNFFKGEVINFNDLKKIKTPNINWLNISCKNSSGILKNVESEKFYFLHSFICQLEDSNFVLATSTYQGIEFPCVIKKKNVFGAQFHPEKSRTQGLTILKNFSNL